MLKYLPSQTPLVAWGGPVWSKSGQWNAWESHWMKPPEKPFGRSRFAWQSHRPLSPCCSALTSFCCLERCWGGWRDCSHPVGSWKVEGAWTLRAAWRSCPIPGCLALDFCYLFKPLNRVFCYLLPNVLFIETLRKGTERGFGWSLFWLSITA